MKSVTERLAYKKWLDAFGFTERDWDRIKHNAMVLSRYYSPPAIPDLDARWRVGACWPETRRHSGGLYIGMYEGRALLAWPKPWSPPAKDPTLDLPAEGAPELKARAA
jgi:hypothetical protein